MSTINTNDTSKMISCLNCGTTFEFDKRKSNRRFCNEDCRCNYYGYISHKAKVEPQTTYLIKKCKFCEKEFECTTTAKDRSFCSNNCKNAFFEKKREEAQLKKESREERYCVYCGKAFIWKSWNQKLCSKECSEKFIEEKTHKDVWSERKVCANCGKEFIWYSNKSNQKYCSYECQRVATKINMKKYSKRHEKTEDLMRTEIYLKVLEIINKMNQSKGNVFDNKYIDYWKTGEISEKTRDEVLKRDRYECQVCRRKDSLHLHHLIKRRNGGDHTADNLVTLCASCHRHIETGDVEHATNTCYKNAKRNYREVEDESTINIDVVRNKLNVLFSKLKESAAGNDLEIMVYLDEVIDLIDNR